MSTEEHAVGHVVAGRLRVGRPLSRRSDAALVRSAQGGSAEAAEELFRRHWPAVHRSAWLVVHDAAAAEDIAQEAFLAAVRNLDRFERGRPVRPWLARIASNRAIDWLRARHRRAETAVDELADGPVADPDPAAAVALIAQLPPEQRQVVALRFVLELTPGEIAALLDLPRGTVNSRLRRGLDALGAALEGQG